MTQFQIISQDPDKTAAFYAQAFGWNVNSANPMGYRKVETGGIPGGIWPAPPQAPTFAQLFIQVDDVKAAAEKASSLGAKILIPPTVLPEGDEMAVLLDPQSLSFGLWTPAATSKPSS